MNFGILFDKWAWLDAVSKPQWKSIYSKFSRYFVESLSILVVVFAKRLELATFFQVNILEFSLQYKAVYTPCFH